MVLGRDAKIAGSRRSTHWLLQPLRAWRALATKSDDEARAAGLVVTVLPWGARSYRHPIFDDPDFRERQRLARAELDQRFGAASSFSRYHSA